MSGSTGGRKLLARECKAKSKYYSVGKSSVGDNSDKIEAFESMDEVDTVTDDLAPLSGVVKRKPSKSRDGSRKSRSMSRRVRSVSRTSVISEPQVLERKRGDRSDGARPISPRRARGRESVSPVMLDRVGDWELEEEGEVSENETESGEEEEISNSDMKVLIKSLATSLLDSNSRKLCDYSQREINSIPSYRDTDEIHSYVVSLEADLGDLNVPRKEWKRILLKKITPKARKLVRGFVCEKSCDYNELRTALVSKLGLQKGEVTDKLFGPDREYRQMDPVSRFNHLRDLMDRLVLHCTNLQQLPRTIVAGIFRATLSPQEKCLLDSHNITTYEDLYQVAAILKTTGVRNSHERGRHRYDRNNSSSSGESVRCFRCHGLGHRAFDCKKPESQHPVICYVCNTPGHKAPECPLRVDKTSRVDNVKVDEKSGKSQRHQPKTQAVASNCNSLIEFKGKCNGKYCMILPDSGAVLTMVSQDLVDDSHYLGTHENLVMANGQMIRRPLAKVKFEIMGREFEQVVAVSQQGERQSFVFLSAPPEDESHATNFIEAVCDREVRRHQASLVSAVEPNNAALSAAVTREASKKAAKREAEQIVLESDVVPPIHFKPGVPALTAEPAGEEPDRDEDVVAEESARNEGEMESVDAGESVSLGSPNVVEESEKDKLRADVDQDETLSQCKELVTRSMNGYAWEDGLIFHECIDDNGDTFNRLVLPVCRRQKILNLVHNKSGNIGVKGMRKLLNRRFIRPGMGCDIVRYTRLCEECLKCNSAGNKKAKMIERPVTTVPFESIAFDLVGPLPKARGGVKFILTYICLASRWPDAVPLRNVAAETVASGMSNIIFRTGIPLRILTDRGSVFMGKVVDKLCSILGVDQLHTSPYRPQSNGILELFTARSSPCSVKLLKMGWTGVISFQWLYSLLGRYLPEPLGFHPTNLYLEEI